MSRMTPILDAVVHPYNLDPSNYRNEQHAQGLTSSRGFRRGNPPVGFGRSRPFGSTPHSKGPGDTSEELSFVSLVGLWPGQ